MTDMRFVSAPPEDFLHVYDCTLTLAFATLTPAVGLIKTISRTKEGSPIVSHKQRRNGYGARGPQLSGISATSQAQMEISASHRWSPSPSGTTGCQELLADVAMRRPADDWARNNPHQILRYLLNCFQQRRNYNPDVNRVNPWFLLGNNT